MLFDVGRASGTKLCRLLCMEYELGGDRAVIIVSALVAILSSSTSVSKDNTGAEECLCRDNLFFRAPEAQLLNGEIPGKRTVLFSDCGHIRGSTLCLKMVSL